MKLFIDGDGSPVVKESVDIAKKYNLNVIIVKNFAHHIEDSYAEVVTVDISNDSADYYIVNRAKKGDIVVTQDYGLAALALAKGVLVINQDGLIFNEYNINSLLDQRYVHAKMRSQGLRHSNPKKRKLEADHKFTAALEELIKNNLD